MYLPGCWDIDRAVPHRLAHGRTLLVWSKDAPRLRAGKASTTGQFALIRSPRRRVLLCHQMINHGLERPRLTESLNGLHLPTKGNLASHSGVGTENICGNTTQRLLVETGGGGDFGRGTRTTAGKHRCPRELRERRVAFDLHRTRTLGPNVPGIHRSLMLNFVKLISRIPRSDEDLVLAVN